MRLGNFLNRLFNLESIVDPAYIQQGPDPTAGTIPAIQYNPSFKFKDGDVVVLTKDYTNGCDATTITRMTVELSKVVRGIESGTQVIVTTRYFDGSNRLHTGKFNQDHLELAPSETSGLTPSPLDLELGEAEEEFLSRVAQAELVFPNYSVVAYDPIPLPGLTVALHGKLLLLMAKRSPHWESKRLEHVAKHPFCAVCGYTLHLNVHHIEPFHQRPDLELVDTNLITLGEACPHGNHHLLFGHFLNWKKANPNVAADATRFFAGISKAA